MGDGVLCPPHRLLVLVNWAPLRPVREAWLG